MKQTWKEIFDWIILDLEEQGRHDYIQESVNIPQVIADFLKERETELSQAINEKYLSAD